MALRTQMNRAAGAWIQRVPGKPRSEKGWPGSPGKRGDNNT